LAFNIFSFTRKNIILSFLHAKVWEAMDKMVHPVICGFTYIYGVVEGLEDPPVRHTGEPEDPKITCNFKF